jgi:hypothetical protein
MGLIVGIVFIFWFRTGKPCTKWRGEAALHSGSAAADTAPAGTATMAIDAGMMIATATGGTPPACCPPFLSCSHAAGIAGSRAVPARSEMLTGATYAVVAAVLMTGVEAMAVARVAGSATARRVDLTTGTARAADTAVGAEGGMGEVAVVAAAADSSSSGFIPMRAPALARLPLVVFVHDFALLLGCRVFARAPNSVAVSSQ